MAFAGKYDDIIIGAGSSGAVLAVRLTEDPNRTVLLIEAGPDFIGLDSYPFPLQNRRHFAMREWDWGYSAFAGIRRIPLPRGRVIGGCSAINGAVALRGVPEDYDEWAALGNTGWGWQDVLPYFNKLETDTDATGDFHGTSGPLPIHRTTRDQLSPFQSAFGEAAEATGVPYVWDHNDPNAHGIGPFPLNAVGETRISTALGYLEPARSRPNLTVVGDTLVDCVLFDAKGVIGIRLASGKTIDSRSVVLSAGSIGTPAILMRSGIGEGGLLNDLGIRVARDTPGVGHHLLEHPTYSVTYVPPAGLDIGAWPLIQQVLRFTAPGSPDRNDMQLLPGTQTDLTTIPTRAKAADAASAFTLSVVVHKSYSQGYVRINSDDPYQAPIINLNLLADERDRRRMRDGIRLAWELAHQAPLSSIVERIGMIDVALLNDDERLMFHIEDWVATTHHSCGTAKMGPANEYMAVVGPDLGVHGVPGLRVADASVIPTMVRANTNLTCVMIGEKAADLMRR